MPRSSNFTDAQKAELFVLHRATCVYSGAVLWLLDGGITPSFTIDWADHVFPVSRGGRSTIENGVCASWEYNWAKRASTKAPPFLVFKGKPTKHLFRQYPTLSRTAVARDLRRLGKLHHSDWYFNRAVFRMLLGIEWLATGRGRRTRDDTYYASAALKAIRKWRAIVVKDKVPSLEARGLAPRRPTGDQRTLLSLRDVRSAKEIRTKMKRALPLYRAAADETHA